MLNSDFRVGPWLVQPSLNTISQNGTSNRVEPKMMEVLVCLAEHTGEVVPKEKLLQVVWPDTFVSDDVLKRSVSELRRVFGDDAHESRIIETIPKRGYRLVVDVKPANGIGAAHLTSSQATEAELPSARPVIRKWRIGFSAMGIVVPICGLLLAFNIGGSRERVFGNGGPPLIRSLAVLPLRNLSGDPSQDYFSDGMTEELITELSRMSGLKVISRTSITRYRNTDKSLPQIARELNVDGIVEGSVLRAGDRVRITAQLIYAPKDTNLWAQTYDRDLRDTLTLQSAAAKAIVDEIRVKMTPEERVQLLKPRPVNPKALDLYLAGRYHSNSGGSYGFLPGMQSLRDEEHSKAVRCFRDAIKEDPDYAPGYFGLADELFSSYIPSEDAVAEARAALMKALALDDSLEDAHLSMAMIRMRHDWDWTRAETEFLRMVELSPNSARGHDQYGYYLDAMGRFDEALQQHQRAQDLDPANDHIGGELYFRRQWDLNRDLAVTQGGPNGSFNGYNNESWYRTVEYTRMGKLREAIAEWQRVAREYGHVNAAAGLGRGYRRSGYTGALREVVKGLEQYSRHAYFPPTFMAHFYGELNEKDRAFAWLEKAYEEHDGDLEFLKVDPLYGENLRSDSRFADLVRRLGLPQ
jgi:TolB-like protein/DNA-binding winged helix-turn-helix (wHTH) protein